MASPTYESKELLGPRSLYKLTKAVAAAGNPEDIYGAALDCLCDSLGVSKAAILLFDPDGVMRFKAWSDLSPQYRAAVEGHTPWTPETTDPQPVLVPDVREDESLASLRHVIESEGIRALAFVPLVIGETLLGKFMLYYDQPHVLSDEELIVAQTIAAHVAFAIDQQQHRRRRDHLDAILRSNGTGIAQIDENARLLVVNDRFCEIAGRTREELLNLTCYDITHPDDVDAAHACVQSLLTGQANIMLEKRYIRPDESQVWVSCSVFAVRDPKGVVTGSIALVTDITERKQAEDAVRERAQHYASLVEALGVAVYTTDAEGYLTSYNEAAVELWGRRPELHRAQWCGSWRAYDENGNEFPLDKAPIALALKEKRSVRDVEVIMERPDGTRANVVPYPTPLFDEERKLVGAVCVLVDVTERKRAELAVARQNEAMRLVTDNLSVGLVVVGRTGRVRMMNPAAERITGYKLADAKGHKLHNLWHHTRPDGTPYPDSECPLTATSRHGRTIAGHEDVFVRPDGSFYDVAINISSLVRDGEVLGAIADLRDITTEKQAETALRETEGALRSAAALKDQFLGLVSHELRTPISTILGNGLLLQRRGDQLRPEDRRQALADLVDEAGKLQEIIENLLLLTRLEGGRLDLEPMSLTHIIQETITEFEHRSPDRSISYESRSDTPLAQGQKTLIQLVMRNLLSNAAKYSPPGSTIEVCLYRNHEGQPEVSVQDYGIGLSPADADHIFTPFYRAQEAQGRAQGMGLGLAVCKRVMEAQGGDIYVESEHGRGSRFVFNLLPLPL